MAFIQSCFIKKNTPELRKKLEELGYKYNGRDTESWGASALYCFDGKYYEVYTAKPSRYHSIVDCGVNEKLFLAIAALRDDNDYMQWFISDETKQFYKCTSNKFDWQQEDIANWLCCISVEYFRKATVEEIIENFKRKDIC